MNKLDFWRQKLVQLFHDPAAKVFFIRAGVGGHKKISRELFEATAGVPLRYVLPEPDRAAAGADRPVCTPTRGTDGAQKVRVDWVTRPVLTHPLASGRPGSNAIYLGGTDKLRSQAGTRALASEITRMVVEGIEKRDDAGADPEMPSGEEERRAQEEEAKLAKLPLWNDAERLQDVCMQLWRQWPELQPSNVDEVIWRHQPADSRAPDHSLWDHLRVASALAFLSRRKPEGPALPWLLAFSIGPVQPFIAESRTSSDLWTSSMLLSDLIWHAMVPFVERYGPEAIVYPDLRQNPRADLWLFEQQGKGRLRDVLPKDADPCSYAGIFPNTFIALVPRGGEGALERLQDIAAAAQVRFKERWGELAALAKEYFLRQASERGHALEPTELAAFNQRWERQHQGVLFATWTASAWPGIEELKDPWNEGDEAMSAWLDRHSSWIRADAIGDYKTARFVYARTNPSIHQLQRGFDYPLIHHALHTRHAVRKAEAKGASIEGESGEKCTLCGVRQALGGGGSERETIDEQRRIARIFWGRFDRASEGGAERLCAVCTMKRFLIRAGSAAEADGSRRMAGLTAAWAGPRADMQKLLDTDEELRVPFPSTSAVAAQDYLCAVSTRPELAPAVAEVVRCCEAAKLPRKSFVRALRSLAEAHAKAGPIGRQFLKYDPEPLVFPEIIAAAVGRAPETPPRDDVEGGGYRRALRDVDGEPVLRSKLEALQNAVDALRRETERRNRRAREAGERTIPLPGTQVALLAIDGDGIRKLLLGADIGARWRDVIHPDVVEQMESNGTTTAAGWQDLLKETRLMGPSTHAFVNRVLGSFAHTIVPWVVEREFDGRLIYAGGDDVLAIAPAAQALDICARLAQLYSAAWVIDTRPSEEPWGWRRWETSPSPDEAADDRFVVVAANTKGEPIQWPIPAASRLPSIVRRGERRRAVADASKGESLLPMMGAGQTLSAGIAIGHSKTALGELVKAAWEERDRAKGKVEATHGVTPLTERNAFSIRRYTRGGEKARLRFSWGERGADPERAFDGYRLVKSVIEAFASGHLSGRLPYKLREVEEAALAVWIEVFPQIEALERNHSEDADQTRQGLIDTVRRFSAGLFEAQADQASPAAFELWWQSLRGAFSAYEHPRRDELKSRRRGGREAHPSGIGSEQGLTVCRFLGALARGEEEAQ